MALNITNPYGPNTTMLLPGNCNAHCDFCFWDRNEAKIKFDHSFTDKALAQLARLPSSFSVLSVSGGEPLLSPEYTRFCLGLIKQRKALRLERTVITTHGGYLHKFLDITLATFDHINISRHAIGYDANVAVFKTNKIPTDEALKKLIRDIHNKSNVDVTLNCVIPIDTGKKFCKEFIKYAKRLGADAVSFRKVASDTSPTPAEIAYRNKHPVVSDTNCPVCRGSEQIDGDGFSIRWKGSVAEPSIQTQGVYEAVLHPDALMYTDWGRKIPFPFDDVPHKQRKIPDIENEFLRRLPYRVLGAGGAGAKSHVNSFEAVGGGGGCGSRGGCGSQGNRGGCGSRGGCGFAGI